MSLYYLQKVSLRAESRRGRRRSAIAAISTALLAEFDLTDEEATALREGDIGLLYVLRRQRPDPDALSRRSSVSSGLIIST